MTRIAVLGAGAGALAAAVDLSRRGYDAGLWARSQAKVEQIRQNGIAHSGVWGDGVQRLSATTDLKAALRDASAALVCLPAPGVVDLVHRLADLGDIPPIILNPGGTGGALLVQHALGARAPAVAEISTLTYTARAVEQRSVHVSALVGQARLGALPGSDLALQAALELYPELQLMPDVLAVSLANLNLVVHPPGSILALAWVEAAQGAFGFYVDAMTRGVSRVLAALDDERLGVAAAAGHDLPDVLAEFVHVGLIDAAAAGGGLAPALADPRSPTASLGAPNSLSHRYYSDDIAHALVAFVDIAAVMQIPTPVARSLLTLGATACGWDRDPDIDLLGLRGSSADALLKRVRG